MEESSAIPTDKAMNRRQSDAHRSSIETSKIINRLSKHILNDQEMSQTQITAALGLLKKTLPDLKVMEVDTSDGPLEVHVYSHAKD